MVARKSQPSSESYLSPESKTLSWILTAFPRNRRYFPKFTRKLLYINSLLESDRIFWKRTSSPKVERHLHYTNTYLFIYSVSAVFGQHDSRISRVNAPPLAFDRFFQKTSESLQHICRIFVSSFPPFIVRTPIWFVIEHVRQVQTVASLGRSGGRPGWHPPGDETRMKKVWLNLQRTVVKRGRTGKKGPGDTLRGWHPSEIKKWQWREKKSSIFWRKKYGWQCRTDRWWWLKRSSVFFRKKIGMTPSVAAPDDTNPGYATEFNSIGWRRTVWSLRSVRTACSTSAFPAIVSMHTATSTTPSTTFLNTSLSSALPSTQTRSSSGRQSTDVLLLLSVDQLAHSLSVSTVDRFASETVVTMFPASVSGITCISCIQDDKPRR